MWWKHFFIDDHDELTTNVWVPKRDTTVNIELRRRSRKVGKPVIKKFPDTWVVYYPNGLYTEHATHREALHVVGRYLQEVREQ